MNEFNISKHKGKNKIFGVVNDNGCWICKSHKPKKRKDGSFSYYQILLGSARKGCKPTLMHRYIYELYNGIIEDGLVVRHMCDNTLCINPKHLELGSQKDNMQDMKNRGRSKKGEKQPNSKLSNEDVLEIRELYKEGKFNQTELSKKFNVSQRLISGIVRRESWSHL